MAIIVVIQSKIDLKAVLMINFHNLAQTHSPIFMAIANITPDSFSDGGQLTSREAIDQYLQECWDNGADIIDIGAESTKPNVTPIDSETEIQRLKALNFPLNASKGKYYSIDTYKSKTAKFALQNGFHIVNDVTGLQHDPDMAKIVADFNAGIILMHNQRLVSNPSGDIIQDVKDGLKTSIDIALKHNIKPQKICLDIGIGFGLKPQENIILINHLNQFKSLGFPILIGASRKSFIEHFLGIKDPQKRSSATLATHYRAIKNGANILRIHDLAKHVQFFAMDQIFN